ncbi:hypothetical protein AKJ45_03770 [candidate division MSBL1 archaeon SCGC-AAA261F19]|uniref:Uncharacterized protein n=1 Tax=candidate division MSBL1 archaeon SCGC-AAA261F19 TaxID=1698275 RepID=A0A133V6F2_9EURY|nr:hypothetical protein AKJ45_03770 [candidate division MSBL1 archaeon SCGC-AAA261F19]
MAVGLWKLGKNQCGKCKLRKTGHEVSYSVKTPIKVLGERKKFKEKRTKEGEMIVEEITFDSLLAVSTIGEPSPIHRYKGKFFSLASSVCLAPQYLKHFFLRI